MQLKNDSFPRYLRPWNIKTDDWGDLQRRRFQSLEKRKRERETRCEMERICESESGMESTYGSKREGDLRMRKKEGNWDAVERQQKIKVYVREREIVWDI